MVSGQEVVCTPFDNNGDNIVGIGDLIDLLARFGDSDLDQDGIWDSAEPCVCRDQFQIAPEGLFGLVAGDGHDGKDIGAGDVVDGAERPSGAMGGLEAPFGAI